MRESILLTEFRNGIKLKIVDDGIFHSGIKVVCCMTQEMMMKRKLQAELNAAFGLSLPQLGGSDGSDVGDPSVAAAQAVAAATNTSSGGAGSSVSGAPGNGASVAGSAGAEVTLVGMASAGSGVVGSSGVAGGSGGSASPKEMPKRLHVSNIPFRFRDPDLRAMFGVIHPSIHSFIHPSIHPSIHPFFNYLLLKFSYFRSIKLLINESC